MAASPRAYAATAVLPEPTSPWISRSMGTLLPTSSRMVSMAAAWSSVSSTARPTFRASPEAPEGPDDWDEAVADDLATAYANAFACDERSAFGGIASRNDSASG